MTPEMEKLVERLQAMYSHRGDGIPTQYVNPDGPEAAALIINLSSALEEAEGALKTARGIAGYTEMEDLDAEAALNVIFESLSQALSNIERLKQ